MDALAGLEWYRGSPRGGVVVLLLKEIADFGRGARSWGAPTWPLSSNCLRYEQLYHDLGQICCNEYS